MTLEKHLRDVVVSESGGVGSLEGELDLEAAEAALADDRLFRALVVQRSRAYVKASQAQDGKSQAIFPVREDPAVAAGRDVTAEAV